MAALKTAGGGTTNYPFFLKHTVADGILWCAVNSSEGLSSCVFESQSECNTNVSNFGDGYVCQENTFTGGVLESYVGFVVTPSMATANPGMTAGTYYLRGGDNGRAYNDNKATLLSAFGSGNCTESSFAFACRVSGLLAYANSNGNVRAIDDAGSNCGVSGDGTSNCEVYVDGGGGGE